MTVISTQPARRDTLAGSPAADSRDVDAHVGDAHVGDSHVGDSPAMRPFRTVWLGGFTLVELLVVIAIIGVLVSLLLPAVQAARAAARRTQCVSQVKQVALAVLNYESAIHALPSLMSWVDDPNASSKPGQWDLGPNWVIRVLPYLEQQSTYDAFDFSKPITHPINEVPRGATINALLCPEDVEYNSVRFSALDAGTLSQFGDNWGRGNYGGNGGLFYTPPSADLVEERRTTQWADSRYRGVLASGFEEKLQRITDGTSNTVLIAEIRAGVVEQDLRGTWAMGGPAASGVAAHGWFGDDNGPNNLGATADDVVGCLVVQNTFGRGAGSKALVSLGMGCSNFGANWQQTMRSKHVGGGHVAMLDGSAQFLSDDIELSQIQACCSVWDRLFLATDGKLIPSDAF